MLYQNTKNHAICDDTMTLSHSYNYIAAFTGSFCEEDRNGCSEIQCFDGVECMDIPAPGVGAVCGACPLGYTGDAQKCYGQWISNKINNHLILVIVVYL